MNTYEVTGISPQSRIRRSLVNGFALRGTLYPPLRLLISDIGMDININKKRRTKDSTDENPV